jgi:hypothetical protein
MQRALDTTVVEVHVQCMAESDTNDGLSAQLARIRHKLHTLRAVHDPGCTIFGAQKHGYKLGAPLPTELLRPLDAAGLLLPTDFRRFITELGNGGAGPVYGWEPFQPSRYVTASLSPFTQANGDEDGSATVFLYEHGCGMYDLLVLRGDGAGQMWLSDDHCDVHPYNQCFVDHYEAWLDRILGQPPQRASVAPPASYIAKQRAQAKPSR